MPLKNSTVSKQGKSDRSVQYNNNASSPRLNKNLINKFSSTDLKTSPKLGYDTLDSAYSTSESSYNTVDSSFSQQSVSSGYDTFEYKTKGLPHVRRWKKDAARKSDIVNPLETNSSQRQLVVNSSSVVEDFQFADDLDDSDTATETETDIEQTIVSQPIDMSYVPDYVRPVATVFISTGTGAVVNSKPVYTSTVTIPSSSLTVLTSSAPNKDASKRSNKTSYTGYRDNYIRQQKEKLCGRKSLDDRLKSLETGASVKLQVCKSSQNRRRKSVEKLIAPTHSNEVETTSERTRDSSINQDDKHDTEDMKVEISRTKAPPPDIIESHQPPIQIEQVSNRLEVTTTLDSTLIPDSSSQKPYPLDHGDEQCVDVLPVSNVRSEQTDAAGFKSIDRTNLNLSSSQPLLHTTKQVEKVSSSSDVIPPNKLLQVSSKPSKLKWRPPSQEALNKLHASVPKLPSPSSDNFDQCSDMSEMKNVDWNEVDEDDSATTPVVTSFNVDRDLTPLVVDATIRDPIVPVELRSPRHDGESRSNVNGKRNARVFVFPHSDESESDNKAAPQNPVKHDHVVPVKFIPSVLRRRGSKSKKEDGELISATTSLQDVKTTISKQTPSEVNKHSSSSTKSTNSSRSKSAHQRSNQVKTKLSRTPSTGSQASPSLSSSGARNHGQSSNASVFVRTKKSHNKRPQTEYVELSDVKRLPSHRIRQISGSTLVSPKQQAVAHAVIGLTGTEGEFPYIDDATTTEDLNEAALADPRERSSSDGALLRDNHQASTARRAFPLSRRGRSNKRKDTSRRTSYMEAMESSEDLTPDPDSDSRKIVRNASVKEENVQLGMYKRSNSVDSVLSTSVEASQPVRRRARATSADRGSLKKSHRRSYQIATNKPVQAALLRQPSHKRQPSIRRLKNFFENNPASGDLQTDEARRRSRGRSLDPLPALVLNESDGDVVREGLLSFKVATIDKGRRTISQKSWKSVWTVMKGNLLYLCKDWSRNKPDAPSNGKEVDVKRTPPSTDRSSHLPPNQLILEEAEPLDIQGSLVGIAYNYLKRKNVFKLTTSNGSEYLFQAEDRDDMLAWIDVIQMKACHNDDGKDFLINKDLILRKSSQIDTGPKPEKRTNRKSKSPKPVRRLGVPVKDVDGSRRFKWRGSVNRIVKKFGQGQVLVPGGTFEVHLEDCPASANNELVPFVVDLCCRIVEEHGLDFTGIYRVPGNSGTLSALQEDLNFRGPDAIDFENDPRLCELNVVSSLLKSFFRKLPDPLFTNELYDDFIAMNRKKDPEARLNGLRRLIHMLPAPHYETLKFLINHLKKVSDHSQINKMEIRNLAIVFGPTLVRSSISDNMATMVTDMSDQCRIVESVLQHAEWFFCDEKNEGYEVETPPVPKEEVHEPVPSIDHLLANVGRTPGDLADDASDSSKSKTSLASEKESFSRDVFDMIFGAGKRFLNPQRAAKDAEADDSSGDEYGFKKSETSLRPSISPSKTPPSSNPTPRKYQVAKPAASGLRAAWPGVVRPSPSDISSKLYNYYLENIDRANRNPPTTTSSKNSSPASTPSTFHPTHVQRTRAIQNRRLSEVGAPRNTSSTTREQSRMYKSSEDIQASSKDLPRDSNLNPSPSVDPGSDSDTSVYVGETLEERLKNLTNLDKKLERRPSRRNRPTVSIKLTPPTSEPVKPCNKKVTAPSKLAGELVTPDNLHLHANKKTTHDLYIERKARKQEHRELIRARRQDNKDTVDTARSNENLVFKRSDPKRQLLQKPAAQEDVSRSRRLRPSCEKVRRRHTLGGSDAPPLDKLLQSDQYTSMQNLNKEDSNSAMARLRPQIGKSVPVLQSLSSSHYSLSDGSSKRSDMLRAESYL